MIPPPPTKKRWSIFFPNGLVNLSSSHSFVKSWRKPKRNPKIWKKHVSCLPIRTKKISTVISIVHEWKEIVIVSTLIISVRIRQITTRRVTQITREISVNLKSCLKDIQEDLKNDVGLDVRIATICRTWTRKCFHRRVVRKKRKKKKKQPLHKKTRLVFANKGLWAGELKEYNYLVRRHKNRTFRILTAALSWEKKRTAYDLYI